MRAGGCAARSIASFSAPARSPETSHPVRLLFLAIGFVCVGLGMAGVFLPGLPTTPFLLIALWAFARSSRRFHDWLYDHPRFGPGLRSWREHGVIPRRVKVTALGGMALSLAAMTFLSRVHWAVWAVTLAVMVFGAAFILSRPSEPKQ